MTPWTASLAAGLLAGAVLWPLSLRLKDASIADILWGPLFILIAAVAALLGEGAFERQLLVSGAVALWGLRLAAHIASRHQGEDARYADMRRRHGANWPLRSLPTVFLLQPLLAWVVSLPVQAAVVRPGGELGPFDAAGLLLFAGGLTFETLADLQLTRFRADPGNRGRVLDTGLWRYSRHPNYFGDALAWWGLGCFGLAAGAPWSLAGPALMTFLLMRVSGVTLLEAEIEGRRPGYARYKRTTSAFFPRPPRP